MIIVPILWAIVFLFNLAETIQEETRSGDILARWRGKISCFSAGNRLGGCDSYCGQGTQKNHSYSDPYQ